MINFLKTNSFSYQINKILIKKYKIEPKNILGHSDIAPERKKDPGEKFPWKELAKEKNRPMAFDISKKIKKKQGY